MKKQPPKIQVRKLISTIYPDELCLEKGEAFRAFGQDSKALEYERASLEFNVENDYGGESFSLALYGIREESDEEYAKRLELMEADKLRLEKNKKSEKEKELKTLARLKKKYPDK